jgi:glycine/D-amino acid oxidase-like deaminating enzyme
VFAVLGYGGNGITFSQIASEIVSTAISGAVDADGKLFAFRRSKFLRKLADLSGKLSH